MCKLVKIIIASLLIVSCNKSNEHWVELQKLDDLLDNQAELVLNSLKGMDAQELSKKERAYYYLLLASATDKNLIPLTEDSTLKISEKYYKGTKNHYNLARTQYYISKCLSNQGEKEHAYDLLKKAEESLEPNKEDYPHLLGLIYSQLARIQDMQNNFQEAEIYSKAALKQFQEAKDTISVTHSLKYLGHLYTNKKEYKKAQKYLEKALGLLDSLKDQRTSKAHDAKAGIFNSLGVLHKNISDIPNALKYGKECVSILSRTNAKIPSEYYYNLSSIFRELKQTDSTIYYCDKMISTARKEGKLVNLINGYKILAEVEENRRNYEKACLLKDTSNFYKDSYNKKNKSAAFIALEKKYDLAQKEKQLLNVKNSRLRLVIISITILFLTTIVGGIFYYKHKKLKVQVKDLAETVEHTQWGFAITKELIIENNEAHSELERIFNRFCTESDTEFYKRLKDAFSRQKANYTSRLYSILTSFDQVFIKKFLEKLPNLTTEDIIMVAMLRHKWNVSDMSAVFHASVDAARKRKSRLAIKISNQLDRKISLEDYIKEIESLL